MPTGDQSFPLKPQTQSLQKPTLKRLSIANLMESCSNCSTRKERGDSSIKLMMLPNAPEEPERGEAG